MKVVWSTYKFRLYPKKEQEEKLVETLEACRQTYNYFLALWKGGIPSKHEISFHLKMLKQERFEIRKVNFKVLQTTIYRLYSNLRNSKIRKFRFKGRGWFKTIVYKQGFKLIKTGKRLDVLYVKGVGYIPIRVFRVVNGKIKQIIIKRYNSGKWFAHICVQNELCLSKKEPKRVIGIDVGIRYFLVDSEGRFVDNHRFYERTLERIKIIQHWLSRKKKGSKNYEKQKMKLAKLYERLVGQRNDFLHKLSRFYVNNYDVICIEDLNIKRMLKNHRLARKILDASWGKFIRLLEYKAERAGVRLVKVNPRGTSRGLSYENPLRDCISACRIKMKGWGSPDSPAEMKFCRDSLASSVKQEASTNEAAHGSAQSRTGLSAL